MNRYVFLDTNIYDEATFSFENPRMTALSKLIVDYNLSLLMCSVCKGEIKKHINDGKMQKSVPTESQNSRN